MTIKFQEEEISRFENGALNCGLSYIGYFSPKGNLISYNNPFGISGHDCWSINGYENPISNIFLCYVSFIIKNSSVKNLLELSQNHADYIKRVRYLETDQIAIMGVRNKKYNDNVFSLEYLIEDINKSIKVDRNIMTSNDHTHYDVGEFYHSILSFFKNAYSNKTFFETIDKRIEVLSKKDFYKNLAKFYRNFYNYLNGSYYMYDDWYYQYLCYEIMQYFKDIAVMYLGYDALERFTTNGDIIKVNKNDYENFFNHTPRIITTSYSNINERFYNYLLMNWDIHKVPRYFWNEQNKKYEKENYYSYFINNEKEEILAKEIQSIKKLVPIKDRYKYFR